MRDTIKTTVTCPKCDAAFILKYSPYSREKTHTCSACGEMIPLPELMPPPRENGPQELPGPSLFKSLAFWITENRYMFCGTICLLVSLLFMINSMLNLEYYIPLAILALVFGVLAVVDRKPIQGLVLILIVTVLCTQLADYLSRQRIGATLQEFKNQMKPFEDALKKQP